VVTTGFVERKTRRIAARAGDDLITNVNRNDKVCGDRLATGPRPSPCYDVWSCAYPEAFLSGGVGHDVFIGGRYHELLLGGRGPDVLRGFR